MWPKWPPGLGAQGCRQGEPLPRLFLPERPGSLHLGLDRRRARTLRRGKRENLAHEHRFLQAACVRLGIDRPVDSAMQGIGNDGGPVSAHQDKLVLLEMFGQMTPELCISDQQIRSVTANLAQVEDRDLRAYKACHVHRRAQRNVLQDAEGDHGGRMTVHHRIDFRPAAIDLAVNEPLQVQALTRGHNRATLEVEQQDVLLGDLRGSDVARQKELLRILGIAHADVAKGIDDVLVEEDVVGRDQVLNEDGAGGRRGWRGVGHCDLQGMAAEQAWPLCPIVSGLDTECGRCYALIHKDVKNLSRLQEINC